jgi:hypothetical protein
VRLGAGYIIIIISTTTTTTTTSGGSSSSSSSSSKLTAIELSLGGSKDKTRKKTYINETVQKTQYRQYRTQ